MNMVIANARLTTPKSVRPNRYSRIICETKLIELRRRRAGKQIDEAAGRSRAQAEGRCGLAFVRCSCRCYASCRGRKDSHACQSQPPFPVPKGAGFNARSPARASRGPTPFQSARTASGGSSVFHCPDLAARTKGTSLRVCLRKMCWSCCACSILRMRSAWLFSIARRRHHCHPEVAASWRCAAS